MFYDIFVFCVFCEPGVANLCKGLRTNMTLKQLHMQFCNITHEGGRYIAELLANSRSALEVINLNGNRLGGLGLAALCKGLIVNTKCETLASADNMIDQVCIFSHFITVTSIHVIHIILYCIL